MHPDPHACSHEPFGITSTPISAMAALGDEPGGIVLVGRRTDLDKYAFEDPTITSGHMRQAFVLRILTPFGIPMGSDNSLRTGTVELTSDNRHEMLRTAIGFLIQAAEQFEGHSLRYDFIAVDEAMFSERITEWAYQNKSELEETQEILDNWSEQYG